MNDKIKIVSSVDEYDEVIDKICAEHELKWHDLAYDRDYIRQCDMIGCEDYYVDSSSCCDDIALGVYSDKAKRLVSFFHELTHLKFGVDSCCLYHREVALWKKTFDVAEQYGYAFSKMIHLWGANNAATYRYEYSCEGNMKKPYEFSITNAAIMEESGKVWYLPPPARHWDVKRFMKENGCPCRGEQGFLLNDGSFVWRGAAMMVARHAKQLLPHVKNLTRDLYTSDIWHDPRDDAEPLATSEEIGG